MVDGLSGLVLNQSAKELECVPKRLLLLRGELVGDGCGEPVVAGGAARLNPLHALWCEGHERLAAVVGVGCAAKEARFLQGCNDLSHGLRAHAFCTREAGDGGGAVFFEANEDSDLGRCEVLAAAMLAYA